MSGLRFSSCAGSRSHSLVHSPGAVSVPVASADGQGRVDPGAHDVCRTGRDAVDVHRDQAEGQRVAVGAVAGCGTGV